MQPILCSSSSLPSLQSSQSDDAILRSLPSDTTELSYLLSSQLLVNYEEEKKLFLADDPLERITLANSLCRVGVMACSEE